MGATWKRTVSEDPYVCGVCGGTLDLHDNRLHRIFMEGQANERELIVAWLKSDGMNVEEGPDKEAYGIMASPKKLAERIERGDYLQ